MKISDAQMFESLEFLRDDDNEISRARARRIVIEDGKKHIKARLMAESKSVSISAKESDAYAAPEYRTFLLGMQAAIEADEHYRLLVDHHKARIEVWRSTEASNRVMDRSAM